MKQGWCVFFVIIFGFTSFHSSCLNLEISLKQLTDSAIFYFFRLSCNFFAIFLALFKLDSCIFSSKSVLGFGLATCWKYTFSLMWGYGSSCVNFLSRRPIRMLPVWIKSTTSLSNAIFFASYLRLPNPTEMKSLIFPCRYELNFSDRLQLYPVIWFFSLSSSSPL